MTPNGPKAHDRLTVFARDMRKVPSDAEKKLWHSLRRHQLDGLHFRRQKPIGRFIADFACDECRLIVEVDGAQHDNAEDYDKRRTELLNEMGWHVIRFAAWDVTKAHGDVLDTILRECRARSPRVPPP